MKAKDYYAKYEGPILEDCKTGSSDSAKSLLLELSREVSVIGDLRKAQCLSAYIAVIKEVNQRWNTICNLFEKKHGKSPLMRNGVKTYWESVIPQLKGRL